MILSKPLRKRSRTSWRRRKRSPTERTVIKKEPKPKQRSWKRLRRKGMTKRVINLAERTMELTYGRTALPTPGIGTGDAEPTTRTLEEGSIMQSTSPRTRKAGDSTEGGFLEEAFTEGDSKEEVSAKEEDLHRNNFTLTITNISAMSTALSLPHINNWKFPGLGQSHQRRIPH